MPRVVSSFRVLVPQTGIGEARICGSEEEVSGGAEAWLVNRGSCPPGEGTANKLWTWARKSCETRGAGPATRP